MKSKAFTYILLLVVAIVWYNVFFRIKSNFGAEEQPFVAQSQQLPHFALHKRDTFPLKAKYRDPFGENTELEKLPDNQNLILETVPKPPPPPPKPHQWPKVTYYGILKKSTSKKPMCIVNIDDISLNLREGDYIFDDYKIKTVYRDSLVLQHKQLQKTYRKK